MEKRKRFDEGEVDGKKVKGLWREAEGGKKAPAAAVVKRDEADRSGDDDGEVEEFFAILRRIQVAVKYFEKGGYGGSKKNLTAATPWSPNFQREDFEVVNGVKSQESMEDNVGLDLNVEPDPDPEPDPAIE